MIQELQTEEVWEEGETGQQQLWMERPEKMVLQGWCLQCLYHLTETVERQRRSVSQIRYFSTHIQMMEAFVTLVA